MAGTENKAALGCTPIQALTQVKARLEEEAEKRKQELPESQQQRILQRERHRQQHEQRVLGQQSKTHAVEDWLRQPNRPSPPSGSSNCSSEESVAPYGASIKCDILDDILRKRAEPESVLLLEKNRIDKNRKRVEKKMQQLEEIKEINIEYHQKLQDERRHITDLEESLKQEKKEFQERQKADEENFSAYEKEVRDLQRKLNVEKRILAEQRQLQKLQYEKTGVCVGQVEDICKSLVRTLHEILHELNPGDRID